MGYIIGSISWSKENKGDNIGLNVTAIIISGTWMIIGYYLTEIILYGNLIAPAASIPGNMAQIIVGLIIGMPMIKLLKRYSKYL